MKKLRRTRPITIVELVFSVTMISLCMCGCGSGSAADTDEYVPSSESNTESTEQSKTSPDRNQNRSSLNSADTNKDDTIEIILNRDCKILTAEETEDLVYSVYDSYCADSMNDPGRLAETTYDLYTTQYDNPGDQFEYGTIRYNGYEMKYGIQIMGEPDENGTYPLYIALHGGGDADSEVNDQQWEDMFYYYSDSVTDGIYVNVRGIADTWNLHFLDESYYMYDRLIEDMILFESADPNRIYLLGFSAGGDGVYQVSARMADRFAASNMSSGHSNGISLKNLMNLPILLQAGIRDNAYDRNKVTVESGMQLDQLSNQYGCGYEHDVFIHVPEGHNYADNDSDEESLQQIVSDPYEFAALIDEDPAFGDVINNPDYAYAMDDDVDDAIDQAVEEAGLETELIDSNAVRWVSQYSRNPYPEKLVWDLDTRASGRAVESFYFLKAPAETSGTLSASYDRNNNSISVDASEADGDFYILFNPFMLDLSQPVNLFVDNVAYKVNVTPSEECIRTSIEETSDLYRVYAAAISYTELLSYETGY